MDPNRKAEQTIRRMCTRNPRTGKRKLSESVARQFFNGGDSRKDLINLFVKNGGCKESHSDFIQIFMHTFALQILAAWIAKVHVKDQSVEVFIYIYMGFK